MLEVYAKKYFRDKRFVRSALKVRFGKAAEIMEFYVEYITKKDYLRIPEFEILI